MDFYSLYASGWSAERIRKSIAERSRAPEEKLETVTRYIRQYNPAYIPTQEQKEQQQHRREVQQRMVAKMTALLENKAEADQSLPSKAHLPRELLAFFRRPMDRKTFDDLNKELSSGDKKKIANACYNQIKEACKGLTAESLRNMTDEQVGDHLEQMAYANYLLVEADVLLGIGKDGVDEGKGYPFTKEQRQEVLRLREELQAPLWMTINRASMIALLRPVPDGKPARCRREFRPKFLIREGIPNTEAVFERKRRIYPFSYRGSGRPAGAGGTGRRPRRPDHLAAAGRYGEQQT